MHLQPRAYKRLIGLTNEAGRDGAYRYAKCMRAAALNAEGCTSGAIAAILKAFRSKVSEWLARYEQHGVEGLLEG